MNLSRKWLSRTSKNLQERRLQSHIIAKFCDLVVPVFFHNCLKNLQMKLILAEGFSEMIEII